MLRKLWHPSNQSKTIFRFPDVTFFWVASFSLLVCSSFLYVFELSCIYHPRLNNAKMAIFQRNRLIMSNALWQHMKCEAKNGAVVIYASLVWNMVDKKRRRKANCRIVEVRVSGHRRAHVYDSYHCSLVRLCWRKVWFAWDCPKLRDQTGHLKILEFIRPDNIKQPKRQKTPFDALIIDRHVDGNRMQIDQKRKITHRI